MLMESSTQMFGADGAAVKLSHTRSPALVQDCVVRGGFILSVHSGNDCLDVPFPSMIIISLTAAMRVVMHGRDS